MPAPYSSTLADHFNSPRNAGALESPDAIGRASLGDRAPYLTIYVKATNGVVTETGFQAFGCGYTIASCSAMTEMITGKTVDECRVITADQLIERLDGMPEYKQFCAQLAIDAMRDAIAGLESRPDEVMRQEGSDGCS